jgi:Flp pilus assembly protein TadD
MRGRHLSRRRTELEVSIEDLAAHSGLGAGELARWETTDARLPKVAAQQARLGLWTIEVARVMDLSGLPVCQDAAAWASGEGPPDVAAVHAHTASCEVCRARDGYARRNAPRMPGATGTALGVLDRAQRLPEPLRSASFGILMVLLFTGLPILGMVAWGIATGDPTRFAVALGLFVVTAVGGSAGGVTHLATRALREQGVLGYYAAWILVIYGYLSGTFLALGLAGPWLEPGAEGGAASDLTGMMEDPVGVGIMLGLGAVFGVVAGRSMRAAEEPDAPAVPRRTGLWKTFVFPGLLIALLGAQFWLSRAPTDRGLGGPALSSEDAARRLPALQESVAAAPDDPAAQYWLGRALAALERHEEAVAPLEHALRLRPDDSGVRNALGWSLLQLERFQDALPHFERALEVTPDYSQAQANLGLTLANLGRFGEATSAFYRYLELVPDDPWGLFTLAQTLAADGRYAEALVQLERLESLDPSALDGWPEWQAFRDHVHQVVGGGG